ncbi:MAG: hypothetical protein AAGA18_02890 [Verrucomicrobiota bacterium]
MIFRFVADSFEVKNLLKSYIKLLNFLAMPLSLMLLASNAFANTDITDVYNLAKSIENSLKSANNMEAKFSKQPITQMAKPRNVYEKALSVVEEFGALYPGSIDIVTHKKMQGLEVSDVKALDIYNVLSLIKNYFVYKKLFREYSGSGEEKTASDVFQMLRSITHHHVVIAKQKNIEVDWATPSRVYIANVTELVPILYALAQNDGITYERYGFPMNPQQDIKPRHVYVLLQMTYNRMSDYYQETTDYFPILLDDIENLDSITPGDVFDLTKILTGELKALSGSINSFDMELSLRHANWRKEKNSIGPGDVYPLIQHAFNLVKSLADAVENVDVTLSKSMTDEITKVSQL